MRLIDYDAVFNHTNIKQVLILIQNDHENFSNQRA